MAFHVGQKVVCVDASTGHQYSKYGAAAEYGLVEGEVYEVVELDRVYDGDQLIGVGGIGGTWYSSRFRPLTDRKSEVSFIMGADPESEKWDNRKVKVRS